MALRFGDLASGLGIWLFVQHARLRPSGAGGGFNRFAHSAGPISRGDSALAFVQ